MYGLYQDLQKGTAESEPIHALLQRGAYTERRLVPQLNLPGLAAESKPEKRTTRKAAKEATSWSSGRSTV